MLRARFTRQRLSICSGGLSQSQCVEAPVCPGTGSGIRVTRKRLYLGRVPAGHERAENPVTEDIPFSQARCVSLQCEQAGGPVTVCVGCSTVPVSRQLTGNLLVGDGAAGTVEALHPVDCSCLARSYVLTYVDPPYANGVVGVWRSAPADDPCTGATGTTTAATLSCLRDADGLCYWLAEVRCQAGTALSVMTGSTGHGDPAVSPMNAGGMAISVDWHSDGGADVCCPRANVFVTGILTVVG